MANGVRLEERIGRGVAGVRRRLEPLWRAPRDPLLPPMRRTLLVTFVLFNALMGLWALDALLAFAGVTSAPGGLTGAGAKVGAVVGLLFTGVLWAVGCALFAAAALAMRPTRRDESVLFRPSDAFVPAPRLRRLPAPSVAEAA